MTKINDILLKFSKGEWISSNDYLKAFGSCNIQRKVEDGILKGGSDGKIFYVKQICK